MVGSIIGLEPLGSCDDAQHHAKRDGSEYDKRIVTEFSLGEIRVVGLYSYLHIGYTHHVIYYLYFSLDLLVL